MDLSRWSLVLQLGTTLPVVGLIWVVQLVSYPLFARVGGAEFAGYHAAHSHLITLVVGPLMTVELGAALAWLFGTSGGVPRPAAWVGAALAAAAWLLTALLSVPQHEILARGFDVRAHERLMSTNWLRTLVWTLRGGLLLWAVTLPGRGSPLERQAGTSSPKD